MRQSPHPWPKIVVLGAGFGGLFACRALGHKDVDVLLVDRLNYHTFTPLLYQVATCALDPGEVAYPIRSIFRGVPNIQVVMGEVTRIDTGARLVEIRLDDILRQEPYDYLILATGSVAEYFGHLDFRQQAFEMQSLSDAVSLRNHILRLFERAAYTQDPAQRAALTTLVVVGGGPTGLETAGALHELYNHVLQEEFSASPPLHARVYLVELQPYVLKPYPQALRQAALEQLRSLGVEVLLSNPVVDISADHIRLQDGAVIPTRTVVWAAGVSASPLTGGLDAPRSPDGRLHVLPTLQVVGHERLYAVGDLAYLEDPRGQPYPMLIPVANQQGRLAAGNILRHIGGQPGAPFRYHDRGMMATIGRSRAVAWIYNRLPLSGYCAWLAWLGLHLVTLLGFRNQLVVLVNWMWNYFTYDRSVRIILDQERRSPPPARQE
ncbi:MAG: NAD(P)/FAD-dependent oxidoreductase [Anaerolineales bacterium]|nr:NAD(P)/FAD-dependent oxidoreductase [Anaerolineales bacterium]